MVIQDPTDYCRVEKKAPRHIKAYGQILSTEKYESMHRSARFVLLHSTRYQGPMVTQDNKFLCDYCLQDQRRICWKTMTNERRRSLVLYAQCLGDDVACEQKDLRPYVHLRGKKDETRRQLSLLCRDLPDQLPISEVRVLAITKRNRGIEL